MCSFSVNLQKLIIVVIIMLIKLLPQTLAFDSLEADQFIPHFINSDFNCIGHS